MKSVSLVFCFLFLYRLYSPKEDWAWLGCLYWLWLATFFLPHIGNANMFLFSQWSPSIPSLTNGTLAPTVFIHHLASLCNDGSYSSFLSHLKKKTVNTSHKKKILISPYSTHHHHYWILHMKSFLSSLPFFFFHSLGIIYRKKRDNVTCEVSPLKFNLLSLVFLSFFFMHKLGNVLMCVS